MIRRFVTSPRVEAKSDGGHSVNLSIRGYLMKSRPVSDAFSRVRTNVPKNVFLDLMDAWASDLPRLVKAQADLGLSGKRRRQSFGLSRHFKFDQSFEETAAKHGGVKLEHVVVNPGQGEPEQERSLHLTTYAFGEVIIGFASHREPGDTPRKTITRRILASANRGIGQADFFGGGRPMGFDCYVTVMAQVDPSDLTNLQNISVALIDTSQEQFIECIPVAAFIEGYAPSSPPKPLIGGVKRVPPFRHQRPERGKKEGG